MTEKAIRISAAAERKRIGTYLRSIRLKRGLTQKDLATGVGLKPLAIINIEMGRPSELNSILNIIRFLGCEMTIEEKNN